MARSATPTPTMSHMFVRQSKVGAKDCASLRRTEARTFTHSSLHPSARPSVRLVANSTGTFSPILQQRTSGGKAFASPQLKVGWRPLLRLPPPVAQSRPPLRPREILQGGPHGETSLNAFHLLGRLSRMKKESSPCYPRAQVETQPRSICDTSLSR